MKKTLGFSGGFFFFFLLGFPSGFFLPKKLSQIALYFQPIRMALPITSFEHVEKVVTQGNSHKGKRKVGQPDFFSQSEWLCPSLLLNTLKKLVTQGNSRKEDDKKNSNSRNESGFVRFSFFFFCHKIIFSFFFSSLSSFSPLSLVPSASPAVTNPLSPQVGFAFTPGISFLKDLFGFFSSSRFLLLFGQSHRPQ